MYVVLILEDCRKIGADRYEQWSRRMSSFTSALTAVELGVDAKLEVLRSVYLLTLNKSCRRIGSNKQMPPQKQKLGRQRA